MATMTDRPRMRAASRALRPGIVPEELRREAPGPIDGQPSDADLVQQSLGGNEDAFSGLVERYERRAFWIAFHILGRVEDARDVVQEAFVRVFRSLSRFDFSRNFYTWFYRIVMNLAIDSLRKRKTSRVAALDSFAGGLEAPEDDAHPAERRETRELVWRVLEGMDTKFKAVLVLRDLHGLSCREIAPILNVTHATVRWRLHKGRKLFRERWERIARRWTE